LSRPVTGDYPPRTSTRLPEWRVDGPRPCRRRYGAAHDGFFGGLVPDPVGKRTELQIVPSVTRPECDQPVAPLLHLGKGGVVAGLGDLLREAVHQANIQMQPVQGSIVIDG
jgi:hypothetical protein